MRMYWLLGAVLMSQTASACINTSSTDKAGRRFFPEELTGEPLVSAMADSWNRRLWREKTKKVIADARRRPDFKHLTDLGVVLIHQDKYSDAVRLFVAIEKLHPGRHETAANLGTALELMGRDALALRWIRLGIQRNRHEHEGTEWLHVRILEAKIALRNDPDYLEGRSVAGVSFDPVALPGLPAAYPLGNDGKPVKPHELNRALRYQLGERLQFVEPKDPVVANLLMDWATLNLAGGPIENAQALYRLAERYGAAHTALTATRQQRLREIVAGTKRKQGDRLGRCTICEPLVEYVPPPRSRTSKREDPSMPPPPPPPPKPYEQ